MNKKTTLIEFNNNQGETLRGVLVKTINKDTVVLMLGGFERTATTEKKFKVLADKLADFHIDSFRFDATDCGLSDGDFYNMTTESLSKDLLLAYNYLISLGYKKISFVVHSLSACALALLINKIDFEKAILIAPALNQKDLLRLWYAQKNSKDKNINWNNYKNNYQEDGFVNSLQVDLLTKTHKLSKEYRLNNQDLDYSDLFNDVNNKLLLIHGTNDDKVPVESLKIEFVNKLIIDNADHDLEVPGVIEQWLDKAVEFIIK